MAKFSTAEINEFKEVLKMLCLQVIDSMKLSEATYAELVSISPLEFKVNSKITLSGKFLVVPKDKIFNENDIGSRFVFLKNLGGQTYFYLYES